MFLALLSILLRYSHGRPPLADCASLWEQRAAEATHVALYGLLLLLPATGAVAMYLTFRVAPIHRILSWMLLIVALAHVAAALWHHLYRRDEVLRRMLGFGAAKKREGASQ